MPIRCVYTDLDGTLLGKGGSMFHDADGQWTMLPARALQMCERVGVEVVIKSGRREAGVRVPATLLGHRSYIYEVGCVLVVDGEREYLTDGFEPRDGRNVFELIEDSGAPMLLLTTYAGRLEYHAPWHRSRDVSHLMRGSVDTLEADALLAAHGHGDLRLVDNGVIAERGTLAFDGPVHAYHLMPRGGSKVRAVARHMQIRGYRAEEVIAVGDSREDLEVAQAVGRFFLVANAVEKDPEITQAIAGRFANVEVTEGRNGEGFYEAVVRSLAEER